MASIEKYQEFLSDIMSSSDISVENKKILYNVLNTSEMQAKIPNESLKDLSESIKASATTAKISPAAILAEVTTIQQKAQKIEQSREENREGTNNSQDQAFSAAAFSSFLASQVTNQNINEAQEKFGISSESAKELCTELAAKNFALSHSSVEKQAFLNEQMLLALLEEDGLAYHKNLRSLMSKGGDTIDIDYSKTILRDELRKLGGELSKIDITTEEGKKQLQSLIDSENFALDYDNPTVRKQILMISSELGLITSFGDRKVISAEEFDAAVATEVDKETNYSAGYRKKLKEEIQKGTIPSYDGTTSVFGRIVKDTVENRTNTFNSNQYKFGNVIKQEASRQTDPDLKQAFDTWADDILKDAFTISNELGRAEIDGKLLTAETVSEEMYIDASRAADSIEYTAPAIQPIDDSYIESLVTQSGVDIPGDHSQNKQTFSNTIIPEIPDFSNFSINPTNIENIKSVAEFVEGSPSEEIEESTPEATAVEHDPDAGLDAKARGEKEVERKPEEVVDQNESKQKNQFNLRDTLKGLINIITRKNKLLSGAQKQQAPDEVQQEPPKGNEVKKNDDSFFSRIAKALGMKKEEPQQIVPETEAKPEATIETSDVFSYVPVDVGKAVQETEAQAKANKEDPNLKKKPDDPTQEQNY